MWLKKIEYRIYCCHQSVHYKIASTVQVNTNLKIAWSCDILLLLLPPVLTSNFSYSEIALPESNLKISWSCAMLLLLTMAGLGSFCPKTICTQKIVEIGSFTIKIILSIHKTSFRKLSKNVKIEKQTNLISLDKN